MSILRKYITLAREHTLFLFYLLFFFSLLCYSLDSLKKKGYINRSKVYFKYIYWNWIWSFNSFWFLAKNWQGVVNYYQNYILWLRLEIDKMVISNNSLKLISLILFEKSKKSSNKLDIFETSHHLCNHSNSNWWVFVQWKNMTTFARWKVELN